MYKNKYIYKLKLLTLKCDFIMKKSFFLFILIFLNFQSYGQINRNGIPFITNYSPEEYNAHEQNWVITKNKEGIMLFGNNHGILSFDGTKWNIWNIHSVISLAVDKSGIVYFGSNNCFGYVGRDYKGKPFNYDLALRIDSIDKQFGNIWKIHIIGDKVYFQSFEALFCYDIPINTTEINKKIPYKVWYPEKEQFHLSFTVNNELYITEKAKGLLRLTGDKLELIPGGLIFSDQRTGIVSYHS